MALSAPGLGSGLDINGIVAQLMEAERLPLAKLNQKEAETQAQISSYGSLKGGLSALQGAMTALKDAATFQATQSNSSDTSIFTVSSDTGAEPSSYNVTVNGLAQAHKLGSDEVASTATFGGGVGDSLTLTVDSNSFTLDLSTAMTLAEIQTAINVDTNQSGVTAGLISGDGDNQTLVLTSGATGFSDRVQLSFGGAVNSATFNFNMLNVDSDNVALSSEAELDASLTIDGVSVTRSSNSITDVISGLTLNIESAGQATASISKDDASATSAVGNFVTSYNNLKTQLATLGDAGASRGVLRNIESQLRGVLNGGASSLGEYSYVSQLGVTTNAETGATEFDASILTTAMKDNPDSVISFFSDENNGFAVKLDSLIETMAKTGGTIDSIVEGAQSRISSFDRNREILENRLEATEQRYLKEFGILDGLMANLSSTSDFLGRQLDSLASILERDR